MKKISVVFGIIVALALVFAGCKYFNKSNDQKDNKIVVGVHSWPGIGPIFVGDEKGFFKEEGVDLEIKTIENFDTKRASLISGQIDVDCGNTLDQLLIYRENGFDASIFIVEDFSTGGDGIVAKTGINSLSDLQGKTVTYAEASPSDFFFRYLLKQNNIPIENIKLKPVADAQIAGNAILAEQVDAAVTFDPWLTQSQDNKNLHLLITTKDYPNLIPGLLIASDKTLTEKKELYEKFTRAWFKSVNYYYSNQEESSKIIARRMNIPESDLASVLSSIHILTQNDNQKSFDKTQPNNMADLVQNINVFWKESGFVKGTFNPDDMLNSGFIK